MYGKKIKEEYEKWGLTINLEKNYMYVWEKEKKLKFHGGEEIKPYIECIYLGTKIDPLGNNTTENKT